MGSVVGAEPVGALWSPTDPCAGGGGSCTPGQTKCKELGGVACQWTCGPGGTWGPGQQCATAICYGAKCAAGTAVM